MPSVFEKARYRLEHERVLLLETLLLFQSDVGASMAPEDWLKLASSVATALYARGPTPGLEGSTENAQHLVSSACDRAFMTQTEAMPPFSALVSYPTDPYCGDMQLLHCGCRTCAHLPSASDITYAFAGHTGAHPRSSPGASAGAGGSRKVHLRKQPPLCGRGSSAEGP